MKKLRNILSYLALSAVLFSSCEKDAEITQMPKVSFPNTPITVSASSVELATANDSTQMLTVTWPAVDYGFETSVTYTVQFDTPADTLTTTPWSNAVSVVAGVSKLSKSFLGVELNKIALSLGLEAGAASKMVVRVQAFADRAAFSNALTISAKPYVTVVGYPVLYVPGDYQVWSPSTAPTIADFKGNKIYEGYIYIPAGGTNYFKYTSAPDWDHINYGDGGNGTFSTDGAAAGLQVAADGYYQLSADLTKNTWTATKTTWSILGDATPGGWTTDTQLNYDVTKQVWTVKADMKQAGSFKFRANNAWTIDFGVDKQGNLAYADNPVFGYTEGIDNITVPADGNYTITLDLHVPGNYTFKLVKN